jgi:S-adenosylmethionine decarboxylase
MQHTPPAAGRARPDLTVVVSAQDPLPDLAPMIHRQRLVIEGRPPEPIDDAAITDYLLGLGEVCGMTVLAAPVTHRSETYGWAGWVHWENSGAHFYAWDQPVRFFSVDIYTCKAFDPHDAVAFTRTFFDASEIVAKEL